MSGPDNCYDKNQQGDAIESKQMMREALFL